MSRQECDRSGNERLEGRELEEFCRRLLRRPELEELFGHYSGEDLVLSAEELQDFLRDQGEDASLCQARSIIRAHELNEQGRAGRWGQGGAGMPWGWRSAWRCPPPRWHRVLRASGERPGDPSPGGQQVLADQQVASTAPGGCGTVGTEHTKVGRDSRWPSTGDTVAAPSRMPHCQGATVVGAGWTWH